MLPLSLVKIGNLKIGKKVNGLPVPTEKILVAMTAKEGNENFAVFPGTNKNGEDSVKVSLPFNSPELNFEINLVSFAQINGEEYIIKTEKENADTFAISLDDRDAQPIYLGKADQSLIKTYKLEKTGLLRVMVEGISGFGEVFHFKTKSIHTIEAISNQLKMLYTLTNKKLVGLPLNLKAYKRDNSKGERFTFLSLSAANIDVIQAQKDKDLSLINIFEEEYKKSREITQAEARELTLVDIIDVFNKEDDGFVELPDNELSDVEKEIYKLKNELKLKKELTLSSLVTFYKKLGNDKEKFKAFFEENKDITLAKLISTSIKLGEK